LTIFVKKLFDNIMRAIIKNKRVEQGMKLKELAANLDMDVTLLSRIESGARLPTKDQVIMIAHALQLNEQSLLEFWMRDKILAEYGAELGLQKAIALVQEVVTNYANSRHDIKLTKPLSKKIALLEDLHKTIQVRRHLLHPKTFGQLMTEYTYESNRIEGNTLTLQETELVIAHGLTISGKSMREHLEAINHNDAIGFVKELAASGSPITEREIMQIHNLVLRGIDQHEAGRLRRHAVIISGTEHVPPQPEHLRDEMDAYMKWYKFNFNKMNPVVMAADIHEKFVTMHPFIDGNGRTSRLLMNLHLLQFGYPLIVLKGDTRSRKAYYLALDAARCKPEQDVFRKFIFEKLENSCKRWLELMK
jgi:Fic family protein